MTSGDVEAAVRSALESRFGGLEARIQQIVSDAVVGSAAAAGVGVGVGTGGAAGPSDDAAGLRAQLDGVVQQMGTLRSDLADVKVGGFVRWFVLLVGFVG